MSTKMNASYYEEFGDLDHIKYGEVDRPEPGEGEVLVRVHSAGINPVDAAVAQGGLKDFIPTEFPVIPGWDVAGIVEKRGHAARRFKEGDKVYAYARRPVVQGGTFAEYVVLPESYLAQAPEKLSLEEAGGIPLVGLTAYQALFDSGNLHEGQTLLVLGASGGVGTMAIQLAKAHGITVIGVASKKNHGYMKELGADITIDYNDTHVGHAISEVYSVGVDLIFDCSRGDSLSQSEEVLKEGGKVVSITNRDPDISKKIDFDYVFVEPNALQLGHIQELANEGKITVPVSKTYDLNEAGQALKDIQSLHTQGKTIIKP